MTHRKLAFALTFVLLTWPVISPVASADELDDAITVLTAFANKTINNADFVKDCLGFAEAPSICTAGDAAGSGLVCPPPPPPATASHTCSLMTSAQADADVGAKLGQLIKLSAKFTIHFVMVSDEKSIPDHLHQLDCSGNSCAQQYVKRQDKVDVLFAMAQEGKISATAPTTLSEVASFSVGGAKAKSFKVGVHHYCTMKDHGDPRSCGRKPVCTGTSCGPTTGEPSTDSDSEGTGPIHGDPTPSPTAPEPEPLCEVEVIGAEPSVFQPGSFFF